MVLSSYNSTIGTESGLRGHSRSVTQTSEDTILNGLGRSGPDSQPRASPASRRAPHRAPPCPWARAGGGAWRRASAVRRGSYRAAHRGAPPPAATGREGSVAGTGPRRPLGPGAPRRRPAQTRSRRRRRGPRGPSTALAPPRTRHPSSSGQSATLRPRPRRRLPWQRLRAGLAAGASCLCDRPTRFPPP